jgi:beta-lactamase regulating signal transducer with metallopeptidase domain
MTAALWLTVVLIITVVLRRRSAALRHAVLAVGLAGAAVMPAFERLVPQVSLAGWADGAFGAATLVGGSAAIQTTTIAATPAPVEWLTVLFWAWAAASLLVAAGLGLDVVRLVRLKRRCRPAAPEWIAETSARAQALGIRRPVRVLQTDAPGVIVAFGTWRPGVILPVDADSWSDERRHLVLTHELAHIKRFDAAMQMAAEVVRCLQPLNPLVWIACRRLRHESELACDDVVLNAGVRPSTYAAHLLELTTRLTGRRAAWASAPAIAHPSTLERRVVAMLDSRRVRQPLSPWGWATIVLVALVCSLPLAAVSVAPEELPLVQAPVPSNPRQTVPPASQPTPEPRRERTPVPTAAPTPAVRPAAQTGSVTGQVVDQSGGAIPGARVTVTHAQTGASRSVISNAPGRFAFTDLPAATYELTVQLSGFKTMRTSIEVGAGATVETPITIEVGAVSEAVIVKCGPGPSLLDRMFPVLHAQAPSTPIRVGGQIRPPKKTRHVAPICPAGVVTENTVVIVEAKIGTDGTVTDARILRAQPEALTTAVLDALSQWEFTPTQLNGETLELSI